MSDIKSVIKQDPIIIELQKIFAKKIDKFRIVGGYVRNLIIGSVRSDIDIATTFDPEQLKDFLINESVEFFEIGGSYGSLGIKVLGVNIEITSTRIDIKSYGRQADVQYIADWEEDSKRRDFTINSLYLDFNGEIYDYHNGLQDIKDNIIKFIGNPQARINEDCLRILRAYRFESQLKKFQIDPDQTKFLVDNINSLSHLSKERVKQELFKIFQSSDAIKYLHYFSDIGLLNVLKLGLNADVSLMPKWQKVEKSPILFLALTCENDSLDSLKRMLLLSNKEFKILQILQSYKIGSILRADLCRIISEYDLVLAKKILELKFCLSDMSENELLTKLSFVEEFKAKKFPVSGNDIKQIGVNDGLEIGKLIKYAKAEWYNSECKIGRSELIDLIKANI